VVNNFAVSVNGIEQDSIVAPAVIKDLQPGDEVTISTQLEYRILNSLMFQTRDTPVTLFADDRLLYSYGDPNTYPAFQKQPPPIVVSVTLPDTAVVSQASGGTAHSTNLLDLRLEYTLLETQTSLAVPVFTEGDKTLLFQDLLGENMLGLVLGLIMLIGSLALISIGLVIMRRAELATSFIWLGMTCLACAIWGLGANYVVIFLIPQSSLLYTLSNVGFFLGIVPLLRFGSTFLQPRYRWPLVVLQLFTCTLFLVTVITHLLGIFSFAQWLPYNQTILFVSLLLFVINVIVETTVFNNRVARLFLASLAAFALFAALELGNQYLGLIRSTGELLQIGLLLFIAVLAIVAWQQVNVAFDAAERSELLELEVASANRNMEMQRTLFETLANSSEEIRKLRHDMRHQLSAIKGMIESGENTEAADYIDTLYGNIPKVSNQLLCDNFAVNALAAHYLAIANSKEIQTDLRLVVPKKLGRVLDNDLCVIVGNLLENAIEACEFVEPHKRFVKISSTVDKNRFTLVVDNSFDGHLKVRRGEFYSRKRGLTTRGIGMQSVRAIVLKYDGTMKYETENQIFKTSLYVKI
jgi:hypothetical protein